MPVRCGRDSALGDGDLQGMTTEIVGFGGLGAAGLRDGVLGSGEGGL